MPEVPAGYDNRDEALAGPCPDASLAPPETRSGSLWEEAGEGAAAVGGVGGGKSFFKRAAHDI